MVWRAEKAKPSMRLCTKPVLHSLCDAGLADTRLTRDQHYRAVASFRPCPTPHQELDLLLATNQRRGRRAQRLETAFDQACAQRCPSVQGPGDAFKVFGSEVLQV